MTIAFVKRFALTLAVVAAPWMLTGCGDTAPTTTPATPTTPAPAAPGGPPTAAGDAGKPAPGK